MSREKSQRLGLVIVIVVVVLWWSLVSFLAVHGIEALTR